MTYFHYKKNKLYCEDTAIDTIAKHVKTPFYVYSKHTLIDRYKEIDDAFSSVPHLICYSVKSNGTLAIINELRKHTCGFDIVSEGELFRCLRVGVRPHRIVFAGVGKRPEEIEYALDSDILMFNCESISEIKTINAVAALKKQTARIAIRVNPNVDAKTHRKITTGKKENKFGIPLSELPVVIKVIRQCNNIELKGLHCHLGSQITTVEPYTRALKKITPHLIALKKKKFPIEYINLGGGFGVSYHNEKTISPKQCAHAIIPYVKKTRCTLILEPGRYISAPAGALITEIIHLKKSPTKQFAIVDAGMNDFMRPALYDAWHHIMPLKKKTTASRTTRKYDIVGPVCESSDVFGYGRVLPNPEQGDILAIMATGAYGFSMSSQYNARPRSAEVMVTGKQWHIIRKPERFADLVRGESILK